LSDLVTNVTSHLRHIVGDAIQILPQLPDGLWKSRIDAGQLAQALSKLAVNAREAMPDGGRLTIEGRNAILDQNDAECHADVAADRYVLLSVADTGTGMTDSVVERAFEPFFTTKPSGSGIGMGLSLVFGFVRQSGGHISIDSKPLGGTTVRLYLPAVCDDIASDTIPVSISPGPLSLPDQGGYPPLHNRTLTVSNSTAAGRRQRDGERFRHAPYETPSGASPVLWHHTENALFASVLVRPGPRQYRLIVEPLPRRNGWDWAVWRPGDPDETSRHGRASSVVSAMAAAEDAARNWHAISPAAG
jgi:hypothetical protein